MNFNVKIFSCALMFALSSANLDAAETGPAAMQKDSSCNAGQFKCEGGDYSPVGRSDRYGVSLMGMYGWNTTWGHYGGAAVGAHLPIVRFFEADADLECHSAGVFSGGVGALHRLRGGGVSAGGGRGDPGACPGGQGVSGPGAEAADGPDRRGV